VLSSSEDVCIAVKEIVMSSDKGTDTHTDHYDSEGNKTGGSESHTEPTWDPLGDALASVFGEGGSEDKDEK
jgi:hypothetical protein